MLRVLAWALPGAKVRLPSSAIKGPAWSEAGDGDLATKGVRRLWQLARLKVVEVREEAASLAALDEEIRRLPRLDVDSISGELYVAGQTYLLEGNRNAITTCRMEGIDGKGSQLFLTLSSAVRSDAEACLHKLFEMAVETKLRALPLRTRSSLSKAEVDLVITESAAKVPLPDGWQFDGRSYVNFEGHRLAERPDLEALLEAWVRSENEKIAFWRAS